MRVNKSKDTNTQSIMDLDIHEEHEVKSFGHQIRNFGIFVVFSEIYHIYVHRDKQAISRIHLIMCDAGDTRHTCNINDFEC